MPKAGELVNVFVKRPSGEARTIPVVVGQDSPRITGGRFTEEVEANADGTVRDITSVRPGERELVLDTTSPDMHEWLAETSGLSGLSLVQYTSMDGSIFSHQAKPMGDMSRNEKNGTTTVTFKGTEIKPE